MIIRATGDRLTYEAQSATGNGWWRVNLEAFYGNGDCDCPHFRCRLASGLRGRSMAQLISEPPLVCKHIIAVLIFHARRHVRDVIDLLEQGRKEPKARHNSED